MIWSKTRFIKIVSVFLCAVFLSMVPLAATPVLADEAEEDTEPKGHIGASTSVILPDRNVSFTVYLDANAALAISATFEYPSDLMEYVGFECKVDGFTLDVAQREGVNGVKYLDVLGISRDLVSTLEGVIPIISFDFHTSKDAKDGANIYLNMIGATASDGHEDFALSDLSYKGVISLTDTTKPAIESVSINGKVLEGFSTDVMQYSIKVEYSVTVLTFDIACVGSTTASVRGHENLSVGENTVFMDVVTETGNKFTYTIKVERLADPNHVISSDATLSDLKLSAGFVTPKIAPEVLDYVIYLPFGTTEFTVEPIATNEYAKAEPFSVTVEANGSQNVEAVVTAEDGKICVYKFSIVVLPEYNGKIPMIGNENIDISKIEFERTDGIVLHLPAKLEAFMKAHDIDGKALLIAAAAAIVLVILLVALLLVIIRKKKKNKKAVLYIEDTDGADLVEKSGYGVGETNVEKDVF